MILEEVDLHFYNFIKVTMKTTQPIPKGGAFDLNGYRFYYNKPSEIQLSKFEAFVIANRERGQGKKRYCSEPIGEYVYDRIAQVKITNIKRIDTQKPQANPPFPRFPHIIE